jgi:formate dehydrogenase iron-sulfur subunit
LSVLNKKRRPTKNAYTVVNQYDPVGSESPVFRKIQCNHCLEPACASACFVKALYKTKEGPVLYNADLCVGCRYCMVACPFTIPSYEYDDPFTPKVVKCTMCSEKTAEKGEPSACAAACPTEAIVFGKRSELIEMARERIRKNPERYQKHIYGEHEMGGTGWLYISNAPFDELDMRMDLGTKSGPEYTKGFLALEPYILVIWPGLLMGLYTFVKRREEISAQEKRDAVADAIDKTTESEKAKAKKAQESALKRAKSTADREQKKAVKEAVEQALAEGSGEDEEEKPDK